MPRNFINWSCNWTLWQREWDGGGGQPPVKSEVRAQSNKVGRLWFLGGRCSRISGGTPKARSRLCVCQASFLMTFATSGMSLAGSWHLDIENPLDSKIKPVNPKGNQPWIFTGRTDAEAEAPILWPPDAKNWLIGKDPDAGKDWKKKEKRMTEDEVVEWHHQLNGHEFEQTLGVADGQGSLASCSPWGCKESDMTERLNWTEPLNSGNF